MLLVHQAGSVKIGEVVRYTLTYTPGNDRILPTPKHLHLKVKNTSAIPLRAAWVHGPYALHVSAYPATFNPHCKVENPKKDGVPEYEPMVKAGGSWSTKLVVPDEIRETGADLGRRRSYQQGQEYSDKEKGKVTWIIEIASQILFSNSASVGFEVLVGRDERSLELGFAAVAAAGHGAPANIKELQGEKERKEARRRNNVQYEGVYSKAVRLVVEDTETLWDKPQLPSWENEDDKEKRKRKSLNIRRKSEDVGIKEAKDDKPKKRRKVHLVILTHGLHSNLGADMLFMKESIDATVAQARADAKKRKEGQRKKTDTSGADKVKSQQDGDDTATAPLTGGQDEFNNAPEDLEDDDDEEETIVRGFNGNAVRTENGIQYLGKRLAKYILRFTYPDQPFLPVHRNLTRKFTDTFTSEAERAKRDGKPAHQGSSVATPRDAKRAEDLPYTFTSISFIGHSLGGLIQTYAVAYIHKHSPTFFQQIKPVNFVCLASPMLGLSNENPMYVKFALDFGLVGRTGQDLGLTWRAPTIANKGWNAMGSIFMNNNTQKGKEDAQADAAAKPLLRVLPTGPAHQVLKMFRNRTVYSNVVNDGIVPLRTSCLLFLDWRGLGKVEKARRENGLIGTVAEWGWAELTGANSTALVPNGQAERAWESEDDSSPVRAGQGDAVPQPAENETTEDSKTLTNRLSFNEEDGNKKTAKNGHSVASPAASENKGVLSTMMSWFGANTASPKPPPQTKKTSKILRRGQTMNLSADPSSEDVSQESAATTTNPTIRPHLHSTSSHQKRPGATRGDSITNPETGEVVAPPKTSIFESAGDILSPPLPTRQWICDPSVRARTIFHDRVYHPEDIPPPPTKKTSRTHSRQSSVSARDGTLNSSTLSMTSNDTTTTTQSNASTTTLTYGSTDTSGMKVEEKIARAYHRDLSWRKVLVRLEPDAHNNIIVRRMFANAYGWPVVKHLCDTHFADTYAARTRDEDEPARERAKPADAPISSEHGEQVMEQTSKPDEVRPRTKSETREARDELAALAVPQTGVDRSNSAKRKSASYSSVGSDGSSNRRESAVWDDALFETSDGEDSDAVDERNLVAKILNPNYAPKKPAPAHHGSSSSSQTPKQSARSPPPGPIQTYTDGHRGLAPYSPTSPTSPRFQSASEVKSASPKNAAAKPTFNTADLETPTVFSNRAIVEEPTPISPTSPTAAAYGSVGLGKSVEEHISSSSPVSTPKGEAAAGGKRSSSGKTLENERDRKPSVD
ncbi:hypothetical protein CKM354_000110000 [Cercospora kikuchii]|uniref:DUF676 domain-containing protein n=1 Tax=Cercospora kikuchii TaxID=84275 RepID=A0A9P3C7D9_9PEZI|nr:uncharacterized protein CKM354_000110000 [Cercospora kikuchii]GIZ37658.1 hypothetical protein CKM354_000110000 [Cercospora kikuchii]